MTVANSPSAVSEHVLPAELPALLQAAIAQAFNAVVITDADFEGGGPYIVFCNAAFCKMTGYSEQEITGQSPRILQGKKTDPTVIDELRNCLNAGLFFHGNTINYRKNGEPYHVEWNISPVRDAEGSITHFVSVQQDITEQLATQKSQAMLASAINATPDIVVITDTKMQIQFVNRSFERVTGYAMDEVRNKPVTTLYPDEEKSLLEKETLMQGDNVIRHSVAHYTKSGEQYFADQSIAALVDKKGNIEYFVSISKDVSERVEIQNQLEEWANNDSLTGLYSRRYGEYILDSFQSQLSVDGGECCIVLCDIDRFKSINDTYGHHCGDDVLRQVAARISETLRNTDIIVRWGGDELLILLPQTKIPEAVELAERLRTDITGMSIPPVGSVTLSIGIASWRQGEQKHSILSRVDKALYTAKERGRNRVELARSFQEKNGR